MRVIVCGGRNFRSPAQVFAELDKLHAKTPITALLQGGATGADRFARDWAETKPGITRYVCEADLGPVRQGGGPDPERQDADLEA